MSYSSELSRLEQERQFVKAVKLNEELLEHLASSLGWFLDQCERRGDLPPHFFQMRESVRRAQELMESLPTDQPTGNTNNINRQRNSTILKVLSNQWDIFFLSRVGT